MGRYAQGYDSVDILQGGCFKDAIGGCTLIILGDFLYCEGAKWRVVVVVAVLGIVAVVGAISVAVAVIDVVFDPCVSRVWCIAQAASYGSGMSVEGRDGGR